MPPESTSEIHRRAAAGIHAVSLRESVRFSVGGSYRPHRQRSGPQSRDHLVRLFGSATPSTRMSSTTSLKKHMSDAMRGHSAIGRG